MSQETPLENLEIFSDTLLATEFRREMNKTRFTIVTPTIGRWDLVKCVTSVVSQRNPNPNNPNLAPPHWEKYTFSDFRQIVVGDGPVQPDWLPNAINWGECIYLQTPIKSDVSEYGAPARNLAMEAIETEYPTDYIIFLDDDNYLLPGCLYHADQAARRNNDPPVVYWDLFLWDKTSDLWLTLPTEMPPKMGRWDSLNGAFRADVIKGMRWHHEYIADFLMAQSLAELYPDGFVKCDGGILAVHT